MSEHVREAIADYFLLTSLAPITVKGKSKPISIYQVEDLLDDTLVNRVQSRGRLIGRKTELAAGEEILQRLMCGSGATLIIQGPTGIGKSHLADNLLSCSEERGARISLNLCRSYNAEIPLACWSAFLRSVTGITSMDYDVRVQEEKFHHFVDEIKLPSKCVPILATLIGLPPEYAFPVHVQSDNGLPREPEKALVLPEARLDEEDIDVLLSMVKGGRVRRRGSNLEVLRQIELQPPSVSDPFRRFLSDRVNEHPRSEIFDTVWIVLKCLSKTTPLVVFFEDAHWMDTTSVDLVHFLAGRMHEIPSLLLLARRSTDTSLSCPASEVGTVLNLEPLDRTGTIALVSHLLITDLAQVIHDESLGNPLFIDEITRWFKRTHNFEAETLQGALRNSDFLQKIVLSGLETISEIQREILRLASVIGVEFSTREIYALLSPFNTQRNSLDLVDLSNHLRAMVKERLIVLIEVGVDARYAFQQSLVRDVLYDSLPYQERRALHARLAEHLSQPLSARHLIQTRISAALEISPTMNPLREIETVAYHFEQAGLWLPAVRGLVKGGEQA